MDAKNLEQKETAKHPVILCLQRTRGKCLEELWPLPLHFTVMKVLYEKARIALL